MSQPIPPSIPNPHELLVQSVVDYAIYMLAPDGRVTSWNAGAERIKGYTQTEIIGQHFSRFYVAEDIEAGVPSRALETARREGRYEAEGWRQRKDGSKFWASVVVDPIYDKGELIGFAKVTRDLTERREAQLQLEASREQVFQLQKMEAVGQLTSGLAHDFNNMLAGISGSLELLRLRLSQGRVTELERYITAAEGAAKRAAAVTHRLLAFARRQTLDPKPTNANRLITEMEELLRRTVGPAITVEVVTAPELWAVSIDANQLENALLNLAINARDAMPNGGKLIIETANHSLDENAACERQLTPGECISVCVCDSGTGMTPNVIARAFDPFFTTKPIGMGTGLGLSMVYGFVRQSGGQVQIHSRPGLGTTIGLYLPRHVGVEEAVNAFPSLRNAPQASAGETVLVVDDEPTVRMLVIDVLADLGYTALEAPDGPAGLTTLQSDRVIDLLITDVGLPKGMNGREFAEIARLTRPNLKVLFITGYAANVVLGQNLDPGMQMLTKPFALEVLAQKIKDMITAD